MQITAGSSIEYCPQTAEVKPDKTRCQQYGKACKAWECPNLFKIGHEIYVLKWSDQVQSIDLIATLSLLQQT